MALTLRSNGVAGGLVGSAWWNDYYNLLTGVMPDQYVTINNGLTLKQITYTSPTAPTLSLVSGTALGIGSYTYAIVYQNSSDQSLPGATATITTTSGNQSTHLASIPTGPSPATQSRIIYRSKVGTSSPLYKVSSIADNTSTTYTDTVPDASLGGVAPKHDFFGGTLIIKDQNSNFKAQIFADGAIWFDSGSITSDGSGNLTVSGNIYPNGEISWTNNPAPSNQLMNLQQNYGLYSDNAGTYGLNRLWVDGPDRGEITLGPRTGANYFDWVRLRGTRITLDLGRNASTNTIGFYVTGGPTSLDNGGITTNGSGTLTTTELLISGGTFGKVTAADTLDAGGLDTFIYARGGAGNLIHLNSGGVALSGDNIQFPSYLGFKTTGGAKLAEIKNNGSFVISGTTYYTTQSTVNYAASATFDSFDFSEVFQVDAEYPAGTIVCPSDTTTAIAYDGTPQSGLPILTQCTHDGCNLAGVVVSVPGFCAGSPNVPSMQEYDSTQPMKQPVAQVGRVFMKTAYTISAGSYVCSDGRGGVRAAATGEKVLALGVALSPTDAAMVPVLIRPTFVSL